MRPEADVQRADPRARRRVLVALGAVGAAAAALAASIERRRLAFHGWLLEHGEVLARHPEWVAVAAGIFMLPLVGAAAYLGRLGARVVRAERLPPPGAVVIRDTPVVRGRAAVRRGRVLQGIAVLLAGAAVVVPVVLALIARSLAPAAPGGGS